MLENKWLDNGIKEISYISKYFNQCYSSEREES